MRLKGTGNALPSEKVRRSMLTGLADLSLPSPGRTRAIRSMVTFLRQSDADREHRALWFAFLTRLLEQRGNGRGELLAALEDSHRPILSLYVRLERDSSAR